MTHRATLALVCGLALSCISASQAVAAQPTSSSSGTPAIFVKAVSAADRGKFAGMRIVEVQQGPIRKSHVEYVLRQGSNSRVWFPSDSQFHGQVIVETSKERLHYYPNRHTIEVLPPKKEEAYERLKQWTQRRHPNLRLTAMHGEMVAGRPTEIGVVSDLKGNVRQRIWMDSQTGALLKREVLDDVGARTAYFEFTQIDYNPIIHAEDFRINVKGAQIVTLIDKLRKLANKNQMVNVALPGSTGFSLQNVNMTQLQGLKVLHEQYQGPRGQLSLFQVSSPVDLQNIRKAQKQGMQFYGWQMDGRSFALVGTYPADELRELSQLIGGPRNGP
ncbi:MAG TPA: hypothetical protein VGL56_15380 [Fimbriimonadaceae bacterium]|jgi:hypothetical protein